MTTTVMKKKTSGRDKTKELPKAIIWRDAIRFLNVGDWFTASLLLRTSIANQIVSVRAEYLKKGIEADFRTEKISETEFKTTRIK